MQLFTLKQTAQDDGDGKCRKSRLYGLILVLRGKIAVGEEFTEIIGVTAGYNYML